jgi:hypothetical protein
MSVRPEIAERGSTACGTPATAGQPQLGYKRESVRRLVSLGFLTDSNRSEPAELRRRIRPGPLKYDHFEVELGADGFPVELGAGAMAITYRARDTVLNSIVALKVIDRGVAKEPRCAFAFLARGTRGRANPSPQCRACLSLW